MIGNEKATSFDSAGGPEVALSTHEFYTFILWIKQEVGPSPIIWWQDCQHSEKPKGERL
jgi:hypothetical protein